jgi:hypothetical protein
MDLSAFVGKLPEEQDGDVLREGIRVLSQALMETEVAGLIGADRHERTPDRTGHRDGYCGRTQGRRARFTPLQRNQNQAADNATLNPSASRRFGESFRSSGRIVPVEVVDPKVVVGHLVP